VETQTIHVSTQKRVSIKRYTLEIHRRLQSARSVEKPFAPGLEVAVKTRAALLMLAAVLTAGPAYANGFLCLFVPDPVRCGSVTYEHAFNFDSEEFFPSVSYIDFFLPYDLWSFPPFDFSLGIPEELRIDIEGTMTLSGRIHDLVGEPEVAVIAAVSTSSLYDPRALGDVLQGFEVCTAAPCEFSFGPSSLGPPASFYPSAGGSFGVFPWDSDPGASLLLRVPFWKYGEIGQNFIAFYGYEGPVSVPLTLRGSISGVARATYIYEVELPEPSTLLLLGSGLIGAEWKRRRRHRQRGPSSRTIADS
jgi:hypothetical protein